MSCKLYIFLLRFLISCVLLFWNSQNYFYFLFGRLGSSWLKHFILFCSSNRMAALILCYHFTVVCTSKRNISSNAVCHTCKFYFTLMTNTCAFIFLLLLWAYSIHLALLSLLLHGYSQRLEVVDWDTGWVYSPMAFNDPKSLWITFVVKR